MAPIDGNPSTREPDLILASTSPYRRSLLERLGVSFRCRAPLCDEAALQREWAGLEPLRLAERLAMTKASSLAGEEPGAAIIGCDQLVSFGGRIFSKPGTTEGAIAQLAMMSGATHELITALFVMRGEDTFRHTELTRMTMRALSLDEIERYVNADQPFDCAGSYKLESRGIALFEKIEGYDHSTILGLPLIGLVSILRILGFAIP